MTRVFPILMTAALFALLSACGSTKPRGQEIRYPTDYSAYDDLYVIVDEMPILLGFDSPARAYAMRGPAIEAPDKGPNGFRELQQRANEDDRCQYRGRVIVQFFVDTNGRVVDPQVARGIGGGCDEVAVDLVSDLWFVPGRDGGERKRVLMSLPVNFGSF